MAVIPVVPLAVEISDRLKNIVLLHHICCLHSLHDQLVAAVTHFSILILQCIADLKQFYTLLLPDSGDRRVISFEQFQLHLHLLHFLYHLL